MAEIQFVQDPTNTSALITCLNAVTTTGSGTPIAMAGLSSVTFRVTGITTATVTFQGTCDAGANWHNVLGNSAASNNVATVSADGLWCLIPGFVLTHIRPNVTAYTSGTITVTALTRVR